MQEVREEAGRFLKEDFPTPREEEERRSEVGMCLVSLRSSQEASEVMRRE